MARNVEIKATLEAREFASVKDRAREISDSGPEVLFQTDIFFHCATGRLKLRKFDVGTAELIAYDRPDQVGPKTSSYIRVDCPYPDSMREALTRSLGIKGIIKKRREVFLTGQTRIHLDQVENLGEFLELEVVLNADESEQHGVRTANSILEKLGIPSPSLVAGAYIDLMEKNNPQFGTLDKND